MTKRVNIFADWHPILAIHEWWVHRVLIYACGLYDRALRAQNMSRATRRQFIRRYGVLAMSVGKEQVMLDYDKLDPAARTLIDGMIARQRGQHGATGASCGVPEALPQPSAPTQEAIPRRKPPAATRE